MRSAVLHFDVGENKGQYLDLALEALSADDYLIHCFEPGVESFKVLTERKKDSRIILNNIGIGKEKGCKTLYYDAPGSGLASLTKRNLDSFGIEFNKSETVQIDTIDNYCEENAINKLSGYLTQINSYKEIDEQFRTTNFIALN